MKRNHIDRSPPEEPTTSISTLDDHVLSVVGGGLKVAYEPYPNVGESPYAYMERLGTYLSAQAGGYVT
jgi:hypothetical protein